MGLKILIIIFLAMIITGEVSLITLYVKREKRNIVLDNLMTLKLKKELARMSLDELEKELGDIDE